MEDATFTIGEVAVQAGTNTSAIRSNERAGVLRAPARTGGQCWYVSQTIDRRRVPDMAQRAPHEQAWVLLATIYGGEPLRAAAGPRVRKLPDVQE